MATTIFTNVHGYVLGTENFLFDPKSNYISYFDSNSENVELIILNTQDQLVHSEGIVRTITLGSKIPSSGNTVKLSTDMYIKNTSGEVEPHCLNCKSNSVEIYPDKITCKVCGHEAEVHRMKEDEV